MGIKITMGIKMTTSDEDIDRVMRDYEERMLKVVLRNLSYIGEKALVVARDTSRPNNYMDQTGNLRSSVGYKVAYNGKVVGGSDFPVVKQGSEGAAEGERLAEGVAVANSAGGFCLVIVAGMKYAYYVEAGHTAANGNYIQPRDVLTSAELTARKLAEQLLK